MVDLQQYTCDRCGKQVDGSEIRTIKYTKGWFDSKHFKDLCGQCNKELVKWVKNK